MGVLWRRASSLVIAAVQARQARGALIAASNGSARRHQPGCTGRSDPSRGTSSCISKLVPRRAVRNLQPSLQALIASLLDQAISAGGTLSDLRDEAVG
jgi:hypothetical protein